MSRSLRQRFDPRTSLVPAVLALVLGTILHAIDQMLFVRAGPVPLLVTAPAVATLSYRYLRATTTGKTLALVAWGVVGSGGAVLVVFLRAVSYQLPRALTEFEMVLYDFGMFLWFVVALTAAYVVAARHTGRAELLALFSGPVLQAAFAFVLIALVESGLYG